MSYDLTLKSTNALDSTTRDCLFTEMRTASVLHGSELCLYSETEGPDCHDLRSALDDGEFTEEEFIQFCHSLGLAADTKSADSARAFLQSKDGHDIATCFLSGDDEAVAAAFAYLRGLAAKHNLILHDHQEGTDIPGSYDKPLPPRFYGTVMGSESPTELVIPLSKGKVVLLLLGAVSFVAVSVWIWSIADDQTRYNPLIMKTAAIAGGSFSGLCALYGCFKVFDTRPGLIIDDQGIVDNSSAVAAGRILWGEVVALNFSKNFITIVVVDPQKFTARGNLLSRMLNAANTKMTGSPINISSHSLGLKFDELAQALTVAFGKHAGARRTNSCALKTDSPAKASSEITASMEPQGFVDLAFGLASHERSADGVQNCIARGTHNGAEVGFRFRLPAQWEQGTLGDTGLTTYKATVTLESLGDSSDRFVAALGELYGGSLQPTSMTPVVTFTAISLGGIPAALEKGAAKIKLFFEPTEDAEEAYEMFYAEHYLNIDLAARTVEFHEKDAGYRDAVLRALSGTTKK